jgi:hypothetical protein
MPDDGIIAGLDIFMDAVKKRWRSIYVKVDSADPGSWRTWLGHGPAQSIAQLSENAP